MSDVPLVVELPLPPRPELALARLQTWPRAALFQSTLQRPGLGRYSFLTADPVRTAEISLETLADTRAGHGTTSDRTTGVFQPTRDWLARPSAPSVPGLPPFQGGIVGLLSYEAGQLWERLPSLGNSVAPAISLGLYDWVLAWDHLDNRAWIIVQPLDSERGCDSAARLAAIKAALNEPDRPGQDLAPRSAPAPSSPSDVFARLPGLRSNFDRPGYVQAVQRVVRYIHAGDIFQANLSQRFSAPVTMPAAELYARLAAVNPAPFAAYYDAGDLQVISASPERFLRLSGAEVETRPIKGTRARRAGVEADLFTRDELRESDKDRAENVMIVDLLRNDLSRVCRPGSIRVPQLCGVETYETVQHLVSEVRGTLRAGFDFFDLLAATFPGGSITGAPKIRAMEIITELEQVPRGPYCGTLFYLGFNGEADSSILIRTFTQTGNVLHFPAGGGITAQSDPESEYNETLHKVEGLLRALAPAGRQE
ncbi:Aminodeoxychorismate synthase component 1 [Caulifigura coniformis]|uniref:aminodeoxychorismate synthase n=1 Tax=Caulifigura coniformis TaxID=2527983 RepID=A0A517SLR3_9PLAN|nr:aminodeoxychorismate synthase component I [Caulifigura coniformis]QDT57063.1 Aminodeoxychorismate synthase component 1 [Caulifigura coniformis]